MNFIDFQQPVTNPDPATAVPTLRLPDGTPLILSLGVKIMLSRIFCKVDPETNELPPYQGPVDNIEDLALIWLAATQPADWHAPVQNPLNTPGLPAVPLIQNTRLWHETMFTFAHTRLREFDGDDLRDLAVALWNGEHSVQVLPKKKTPTLTRTTTPPPSSPHGMSNTSTSSPEATSPSGNTASTDSPSPPSTAGSTATSTASESTASPPPNETED